MKQMPVESRLAWLGRPASRAMRAHLALVQVADGEERARELRLVQAVQEVALVLAGIDALEQPKRAVALLARARSARWRCAPRRAPWRGRGTP